MIKLVLNGAPASNERKPGVSSVPRVEEWKKRTLHLPKGRKRGGKEKETTLFSPPFVLSISLPITFTLPNFSPLIFKDVARTRGKRRVSGKVQRDRSRHDFERENFVHDRYSYSYSSQTFEMRFFNRSARRRGGVFCLRFIAIRLAFPRGRAVAR